jgi:hypothetical protein
MKTDEAHQHLAAPASPNVMGRDRMQIIETRWVKPNWPPGAAPVPVRMTGPWFTF